MRSRRQRNWEDATEALGCVPRPSVSDVIKAATKRAREMTARIEKRNEERARLIERLEKFLADEPLRGHTATMAYVDDATLFDEEE